MRRRTLLSLAAASPLARPALAQPALAQTAPPQHTWPTKPVRYIVPYPPGGNTDVVGRVIAAKLSAVWGQQVVVDNRPGGGANIGAEAAARAPADGYTLFQGTGSTHGINPHVFPNLPFDPVRDFTPVVLLVESPIYLVVTNRLNVRTLDELIAYARANPGKLSYASVGIGSAHHLAGAMLCQRAGIQMEHVPYRGSAQVITDLIAGTVEVAWDVSAITQAREGRLRVLAVGGSRRNPSYPEVPAMSELGFPDFEVGGWFGILGPAGMPRPIVERVNADANTAIRLPDVIARFDEVGLRPLGGTPEDMARHIREELRRWGEVARAANVRVSG